MKNEVNPEIDQISIFEHDSFTQVWDLEDITWSDDEKSDDDLKVIRDKETARDKIIRMGDFHICGCEFNKKQAIISISIGFLGILAIILISLGVPLARRNNMLCCTPKTLDSVVPDSVNYDISVEWQAVNYNGNRSWYTKWSSKINNVTIGKPVHKSNGEVTVILQHVYDDKDAWVSVSASVMCCTNEWIAMDRLDTIDSYGKWSSLENCVCEDVWFDSQVRVAVTGNNS